MVRILRKPSKVNHYLNLPFKRHSEGAFALDAKTEINFQNRDIEGFKIEILKVYLSFSAQFERTLRGDKLEN